MHTILSLQITLAYFLILRKKQIYEIILFWVRREIH